MVDRSIGGNVKRHRIMFNMKTSPAPEQSPGTSHQSEHLIKAHRNASQNKSTMHNSIALDVGVRHALTQLFSSVLVVKTFNRRIDSKFFHLLEQTCLEARDLLTLNISVSTFIFSSVHVYSFLARGSKYKVF